MREIKFRAWHKKRKKFYEVLHLHIYTIMDKGPWATCRGRNCIEQQDVHIQVQPEDCLIEQFTGLLDKNGEEIYEGDIVSGCNGSINGADWPVQPFEIVWHNCGFNVPMWGVKGNQDSTHWIEVIGNIHENPELLEGLS